MQHFILREIGALIDLKGHACIAELVDIFKVKGSGKIVLSFKYEHGGDLMRVIKRSQEIAVLHSGGDQSSLRRRLKRGLPEPLVICFAIQLLQGLSFTHEKGWIHRDLKPGNLLVNQKVSSKLLGADANQCQDDFKKKSDWKDCM